MSARLGVNIDHVATLRQARRTIYPDPVQAALLAEQAGADLITLHLREDRRHIQDRDVEELRRRLTTRMNLESALTEEMMQFALRVLPQDLCLVPERREELTTEGGLAVAAAETRVGDACARLAAAGIRVSLFIDPDATQIHAARAVAAPVVELHTGRYAELEGEARAAELRRIREAAELARGLGLAVHAGHGLTVDNVQPVAAIKTIEELNIGHAIVARAVFIGWQHAIREMKRVIAAARG